MEDTRATWLPAREGALRQFFGLSPDAPLRDPAAVPPEINETAAACLKRFNLEWHLIPTRQSVAKPSATISRLAFGAQEFQAK